VQHRDGAGRGHGQRQYLSHGVCRWERSGRTKVITDMECRAWRRGYVYYLSRPAVSNRVSRRGRGRTSACRVRDGRWDSMANG
jgi:hypothetical protein